MANFPTAPFDDVLRFWFDEITPPQWWKVDADFDRMIATRFGAVHRQAAQGELWGWRADARGRLAEIIVLDQFSRNIHRNTPLAFAQDPMALVLAQEAVACGALEHLSAVERTFACMPYMHSESARVHVEAERLFRANGVEDNLNFELRHKAIVDRFGRYPHRNDVLGRTSTPEEVEFLKQPGSRF